MKTTLFRRLCCSKTRHVCSTRRKKKACVEIIRCITITHWCEILQWLFTVCVPALNSHEYTKTKHRSRKQAGKWSNMNSVLLCFMSEIKGQLNVTDEILLSRCIFFSYTWIFFKPIFSLCYTRNACRLPMSANTKKNTSGRTGDENESQRELLIL